MEERIQNAVAGDYMITGAILNDEIERFKSLPAVKAMDTLNSIKYNNALKRNYRLSDAEFGDGTYSAVTDGGSFYQILDANDEPVIKITEGELFQRMFQKEWFYCKFPHRGAASYCSSSHAESYDYGRCYW